MARFMKIATCSLCVRREFVELAVGSVGSIFPPDIPSTSEKFLLTETDRAGWEARTSAFAVAPDDGPVDWAITLVNSSVVNARNLKCLRTPASSRMNRRTEKSPESKLLLLASAPAQDNAAEMSEASE
jgi:hypothetical protein